MAVQPARTRWIIITLVALAIVFAAGIFIGHFGIPRAYSSGGGHNPPALTTEQVRQKMFAEIKPDNIRNYLRSMTKTPHPAGSAANNAVANYIKESFESSLGEEHIKEAAYDVLLSRANTTHPNTVSILNADESTEFLLQNREDPAGQYDSAYFAFAPAGEVTATTLIYANEAKDEDFDYLLNDRSLVVNGSIILARYGGFRGDQVETSAKYGAKAVLLFPDPSLVAVHGTADSLTYPNGPWMPPSAISRGSVFRGKGDPLSQAFVSETGKKGRGYRTLIKDSNMPKIPAVPIGYGDARKLFSIMGSEIPPKKWQPSTSMDYRVGGQLSNDRRVTVSVTNYEERQRITNVIATIPGCQEPDRYVLLGNHFDAWLYGGIDPNSGTATMLELARVMGVLRKEVSWCPGRTIIFGAWDAEEYGLIGSTEWVEENLQILQERAVAYINIDASVRGRVSFSALAMPLLTDVIYAATKLVTDPVSEGGSHQSVYDVWWSDRNYSAPYIHNVGAGSDYANFVNMIGVTSADLRYNGITANPSYHTAYETFEYIEKFVDPTFLYHAAVTKVWGEIVRDLADSAVIPFSILPLAERMAASWLDTQSFFVNASGLDVTKYIDFDSLTESIDLFGKNSKVLAVDLANFQTDGRLKDALLVREMNDRLIKVERIFIDPNGLPGRPLERHVLQAPSKVNSYGSSSFPGLMDCVAFVNEAKKEGDLTKESYWLNELQLHYMKVTQIVDRAARFLVTSSHSLTQTGARKFLYGVV